VNPEIQYTNGSSDSGKVWSMDSSFYNNAYSSMVGDSVSYLYNSDSGKVHQIRYETDDRDFGDIYSTFEYDGMLTTSETTQFLVVPGLAGDPEIAIGYVHDSHFRLGTLSVGGVDTEFLYDGSEMLTGAGGITIGRDNKTGLMTSTTLGSISSSISGPSGGAPAYNGFGEVMEETYKFGTTPGLYNVSYTRDKLGRIITKDESIDGESQIFWVFGYDSVGRLTEVEWEKNGDLYCRTYAYGDANSNDNRTHLTETHDTVAPNGCGPEDEATTTTISGTYDLQDRMTAYNGVYYSYNQSGQLSSKNNGTDMITYSYDGLGNLHTVKLPGGDLIEYLVDGLGRRVGRLTGETKEDLDFKRGWVYKDALNPVAELDQNGNVIKVFVYGTRSNVPDYMKYFNGTSWDDYRIISDQVGSPRLVVNASTGAIALRIDYDEFGNETNVDPIGNRTFIPFGFAGGLYDEDTGLVRFGARDYDPEIGRWTTKDPILFAGGDANLYGYVMMEPINLKDSSGMDVYLTQGGSNTSTPLHQDLLVDSPNGRKAFSYGLNSLSPGYRTWFFGLPVPVWTPWEGVVFASDNTDGEVIDKIDTTSEQDEALIRVLDSWSWKKKGPYGLGFANCRTFVQQMMETLRNLLSPCDK
jgi:RHS repeat-associated protein